MRNRRFNRNMFGTLPTQKMAQDALPILVSRAQNDDVILLHKLAENIAPELTQFNWSLGWAFGWIHTTLYELERRDDWNYGEIPNITAIVLNKPNTPTNWMKKQTRTDPNTPLPYDEYYRHHILPVFAYSHWDKVMDYVRKKLSLQST